MKLIQLQQIRSDATDQALDELQISWEECSSCHESDVESNSVQIYGSKSIEQHILSCTPQFSSFAALLYNCIICQRGCSCIEFVKIQFDTFKQHFPAYQLELNTMKSNRKYYTQTSRVISHQSLYFALAYCNVLKPAQIA
ncbi:Hypothetical_protein [Hexamita inflata]|uniref:Hypothetical_protein n=1 Tax=Hexamita inflata TaxID=28002 RepID=A0AA86UAZ9_9EUKA|nr:Hypothetical protein HINF_LOCUS38235 [Hexamita inflata]